MNISSQMKTDSSSQNELENESYIFHIDLDCFFAAIEMREEPTLLGKPVIVGGNKETKRGVVCTCNYKAREYGISSGMSIYKALSLCPEAVCVHRSFKLYRKVSENIMDILNSYTNQFIQASIDEAYLNVTSLIKEQYDNDPLALAKEIKEKVHEKEQITCSIGIGPNKTIAKIATSQNKPDGITRVAKSEILEFLYPLPINRISGIGPKTTTWLKKQHKIETIGDIIDIGSEYELIRKFGRFGKFFYKVISGQGKIELLPTSKPRRKSISKGRTFYRRTKDGEKITADSVLETLVDTLMEKIKEKKIRYRVITVEVKYQQNLQVRSKSCSFLTANDDKHRLISTSKQLLEDLKTPDKEIRKVAVRLSKLEQTSKKQTLLDDFF
jgi:DNA polymerase IV (DinB-like DNA polymerase)